MESWGSVKDARSGRLLRSETEPRMQGGRPQESPCVEATSKQDRAARRAGRARSDWQRLARRQPHRGELRGAGAAAQAPDGHWVRTGKS